MLSRIFTACYFYTANGNSIEQHHVSCLGSFSWSILGILIVNWYDWTHTHTQRHNLLCNTDHTP